jgi:hypothetical protein
MFQKYSIRNQQGRSVQTRPPTTQPLEPAPASSSSTFVEIWLRKRVPACVALSCLSYLPELRACNQLAHASKCNNIKRHARDWIFAWTASRVAGMAGVQVLLEKWEFAFFSLNTQFLFCPLSNREVHDQIPVLNRGNWGNSNLILTLQKEWLFEIVSTHAPWVSWSLSPYFLSDLIWIVLPQIPSYGLSRVNVRPSQYLFLTDGNWTKFRTCFQFHRFLFDDEVLRRQLGIDEIVVRKRRVRQGKTDQRSRNGAVKWCSGIFSDHRLSLGSFISVILYSMYCNKWKWWWSDACMSFTVISE